MQDSSKEWALRLLLADSSAGFRDMKLDLEAWRCLEMPGGLEPELPTPTFRRQPPVGPLRWRCNEAAAGKRPQLPRKDSGILRPSARHSDS